MVFRRFSPQGKQERLQERMRDQAPPGPLGEFYHRPSPSPILQVRETPFLAIDLETTGLDPQTDHILSIGFVPIDGFAITLAGARRLMVRPTADVGESAVFHGITHDEAQTGMPIAQALEPTLAALQGRILVAHAAGIETGFLDQACRNVYGTGLTVPSLDTLELSQHLGNSSRHDDDNAALAGAHRLQSARDTFGLPRYRAHDALVDALACAELFLAQTAFLADDGRTSVAALRRILR